jgi:hypothetical protein
MKWYFLNSRKKEERYPVRNVINFHYGENYTALLKDIKEDLNRNVCIYTYIMYI